MRYFAIIAIIIAGSCIYSAESHGGMSLDFQYWQFDESFDHDTHPDDKSFLVGRAGETELQDGYALALKYELPIADEEKGMYLSLSGGLIIIGDAEEKRKNDNDPRPIGEHSEIYSRIDSGVGPLIGADVGWKFHKSFYFGLSADATWLRVEHGWNRFNSYEPVDRKWKTFVSAGPEVRFFFGDSFILFAGYNFGNANHGKIGVLIEF